MAILSTSGTFTATQSVIQILNAALRLAQVIGDEETATGSQLQSAMDAMTAMTKAWQASGIHVWAEEECILFLQPNQILYRIGTGSTDHCTLWDSLVQNQLAATALAGATSLTLPSIAGISRGDTIGVQLDAGTNFWTTVSAVPSGATVPIATPMPSAATQGAFVFDYTTPLYRPLRVMGGRQYNYLSRIDIPMIQWARLDYQSQPNKYSTGTPTAFFYDPQTGQGQYQQPVGQMNIWTNPANNSNACRFTAQRPIQDVGSLANTLDFPVEWNACLKWNVALEVAPEFGCPMEQMAIIDKQATKYFSMAKEWDREPESILFGVAFQPGYRR